MVNINTIEDLNNIRNGLGSSYIMLRDLDFNDDNSYSNPANKTTYTTGVGFRPIGSDGVAFTGIFDGNGHTISNLYIKCNNIDGGVGLFGITSTPSEIKNVGMINVNVNPDDPGFGISYVGGLVGFTIGATISKCYAKGNVGNVNCGVIGGLVGGTITTSSISNCYADVQATGGYYCGGFAGYCAVTSTFTNSYSVGLVTASSDVGGFCGNNAGTITNCFYDSQTSGQSDTGRGTPRTTIQMKDFNTFNGAGWNIAKAENWINEIWRINDGVEYPKLFFEMSMAQSTSIDYNNGLITQAKLTATGTGSFNYYLTADGTNWESVTSGVIHTFINTGIDLRWRIIGTGIITKIIISNYTSPTTSLYLPTDTELNGEFYRTLFGTQDISTDKILNSSISINSTVGSLQGIPFTEIGSFNDSSAGTMFTRYTFPDLTLNNTSNYRFTIQTTIDDSSSFNAISPTSGLNAMRNWFAGQTIIPPTYIAWGNGTTALDITDTTLEGELQRNIIGSKSVVNTTASMETLLTYSQGNGENISKSGLFNDISAGTLWFEQLNTSPIAKANTFQIDETDRIVII